MTTHSDPTPSIAETIYDQIGRQAMVMMGATNVVSDTNLLRWKIGRNAKGVTHIEVKLESDDTYTVTFSKVGRAPYFTVTPLGEVAMLVASQLRELIERRTGMYLSL